MKTHFLSLIVAVCAFSFASADNATGVVVHETDEGALIPREIYGQFAEDLGTCVYGGLWVGKNSDIPNVDGYRTDVLNALKALKVPVLRWPGGCFADTYHWRDGIGPQEQRKPMINSNWGGTMVDNSFGTNEYLNLCELIGAEPYVSMNVGSGTVEEAAEWIEYMTAEKGPMSELRKQNGREKPWKVKYVGIGNESWGCGGNMRPEYYADLYRRFASFCHNYDGNNLFKIASGASDYDYNWTDVLMKNVGGRMNGLSLHYYTVLGWNGSKGKATDFSSDDYYWTIGKCLGIEEVLLKHMEIMDKYDPQNHIGLMVDEWGTWWDEEEGTVQGHLYQQNTLRDAFVAALSLNVFHKYTDRIKMTNIAQVVNVLQSMILTKSEKMVLTPTYFVFKMYNVHQNARNLPVEVEAVARKVKNEQGGERTIRLADATASRDENGMIHISLSNADLDNADKVTIRFDALKAKSVSGEILTASDVEAHNTFESPDAVKIRPFTKFKAKGNTIVVEMPPKSIVTLSVK